MIMFFSYCFLILFAQWAFGLAQTESNPFTLTKAAEEQTDSEKSRVDIQSNQFQHNVESRALAITNESDMVTEVQMNDTNVMDSMLIGPLEKEKILPLTKAEKKEQKQLLKSGITSMKEVFSRKVEAEKDKEFYDLPYIKGENTINYSYRDMLVIGARRFHAHYLFTTKEFMQGMIGETELKPDEALVFYGFNQKPHSVILHMGGVTVGDLYAICVIDDVVNQVIVLKRRVNKLYYFNNQCDYFIEVLKHKNNKGIRTNQVIRVDPKYLENDSKKLIIAKKWAS